MQSMGQYDQLLIINISTDDQGQLGNLYWLSGVPVAGILQGNELYSTVTVDGTNLQVELYPSDAVRADVSWSTTDSNLVGELTQTPVGVSQAHQGTMMLAIEEDWVTGHIDLTGTTWLEQESTLQAEFSGQASTPISTQDESKKFSRRPKVKASPKVVLAQVNEQQTMFTGTWEADGWGEIELRQNGNQVEGTYSGERTGQISGNVEGTRLEFTWQGNEGSGEGYFRALAGGQTLLGQWTSKAHPQTRETITAARTSGSTIDPTEIEITDPSELRFRGQDLARQGLCQDAIVFLQKAFEAYDDSNGPGTSDLTRDSNLISQVSILNELSFCHIRLANYDELIRNLTEGVAIREQLTETAYLRPSAQESLGQITDIFDTWRVRLTSDIERISALDKSQEFFQQLTKALVDLKDTDGALVAAEKGRARAIADIMSANLLEANTNRTDNRAITNAGRN